MQITVRCLSSCCLINHKGQTLVEAEIHAGKFSSNTQNICQYELPTYLPYQITFFLMSMLNCLYQQPYYIEHNHTDKSHVFLLGESCLVLWFRKIHTIILYNNCITLFFFFSENKNRFLLKHIPISKLPSITPTKEDGMSNLLSICVIVLFR